MNSIGAIEVKNALLKSNTQKSVDPCERAPARITKRASEVKNGLQTVERILATSVQTRLRNRSDVGEGRGACTGTGFRSRLSKDPRMILERISSPNDVKRLTRPELDQLAREIRETLIRVCA